MEFYIIGNLVYLTSYNGNFVILDINNDRYILLDYEDSESLWSYIVYGNKPNQQIISLIKSRVINRQKILNRVDNFKISEIKAVITPDIEYEIHQYSSRLSDINVSISSWLDFLVALFLASIITVLVKFGYMSYCFKYLIWLISKKKREQSIKRAQKHIAIVNKACQWLPYKIKCLEWALCCTITAAQKGVYIDLLIGVRCLPFMAHAWVEQQGLSIIDEIKYKDFYSVIFSTRECI